jgi:polyphosphate kinase
MPRDLADPSLYHNRELSWLQFNRRVLEEGQDSTVPLLERLKFLAIVSSNLDEFFMVRVGGLQQKVQSGIARGSGGDQMPPHEQLRLIAHAVRDLVVDQYRTLAEVLPALRNHGIVIRTLRELNADDRKHLGTVFREQIFPVLTPLAVDPGHPFPHLANKSLNIAVMLSRAAPDADPLYAVVQVPGVLPRFFSLPMAKPDTVFVALEDVIQLHLSDLFPGMEIATAVPFRVTRDSEYEIDDEAEDLLRAVEDSVKKRRRGHASRLEIAAEATADVETFLTTSLDLHPEDVTRAPGLLDLTGLFQITNLPGFADLRDPPYVPVVPKEFAQSPNNLWAAIRGKDILVHHPYESFAPVTDLIEAAANDDRVLAIKQTLYRTSSDSPIVKALGHAADRGKQVTAVIEIKARLDEERNIKWAKELEKFGVHVVYGVVGLKTHCKVALIVRRDEDNVIRRYVHLSTGNYNPTTARTYTDIGYFTTRTDFADDVTQLFNNLTGYAVTPQYKKLIVAPSKMQAYFIDRIDREAAHKLVGKPARIVVKLNGLLEPAVVQALYRASIAGVPIDIVCRGICALRPGMPDLSSTIRVTSVVDRFLEHSRIFYFENEGNSEVYIGSADWMDRNLSRRVEVVFPIEQPDLKARLIDEILMTSVHDTVKARELQPDGSYRRVMPRDGQPLLRSQQRFLDLAADAAQFAMTASGTMPVLTSPQTLSKPKPKKPTRRSSP